MPVALQRSSSSPQSTYRMDHTLRPALELPDVPTLAEAPRSAAIGQRAIAISAGPPLRRGALRGAHGKPGRARALAWNRVCGAIGFESSMRALVWLLVWLPAKTAEWLN